MVTKNGPDPDAAKAPVTGGENSEPPRPDVTLLAASRYRDLLADLRALVEERSRGERGLAAFDAAEDVPTAYQLDEALGGLAETYRSDVAAADERHAAERQASEAQHRAVLAAAEAELERTSAAIRQRFAEELAAAEHRYEEDCWMLSSLADDDSRENPKQKYETLRAQLRQSQDHLAARWDDLKAIHSRAVELIESRRQRAHDEAEPPPTPRNRQEAMTAFDAAAVTVERSYARLRGQTVPRLFTGWAVALIALVLWGGFFAAAYFFADYGKLGIRVADPSAPVLISGGVGLVACVLILGVLWSVAATQTARAFAPLRQAMAVAEVSQQQWQRLAKEELKRAEREYQERYRDVVEHRDRSFRRFATERDRRVADLTAEQDRQLREPAWRREAALRESSERLNRDLLASEIAHRRDTTALRTRFEREQQRFTQEHHHFVGERAAEHERRVQDLLAGWAAGVDRLRSAADAASATSAALFPEWPAITAKHWTPPEQIPPGLKIGEYEIVAEPAADVAPPDPRLASEPVAVRLPAVSPFPESPSLFLEAPAAARADAVSLLQVAALRVLTLLPPGKVRFTFIDPVGLGESFAAFMHLADFDDLLISGRVWTESAEIDERLGDLTGHMENVFQKYLRNEFESLEEYNAHAGEVAEPYRILVVANYPAGFTERAAQRLESIVSSGPRCGVYTLLGFDPRQRGPRGFDPASLSDEANVLRWQDGRFVTDALGPEPVPLVADPPPSPGLFAAVVRKIGELSKDVRRVEVPFRRIVPTADQWWTADSRRTIDCPLGRSGATKLQHMRLGLGTAQHVLVAGKTGSGKSTLLHVLVTNLALRYSPDEVEFYLIDFKKGVEFKTYAAHALPHARVIAIESDREFGVSVLERLDAVLRTRGDLFREVGVQDVASFRDARPGIPMPRILLVVDEFQEFFTEDDRYAQTASLLLDRLVRQGRAFGIHVLLGSQTLGGAYSLARATIGQMAVRVALQCGESDAHLILSEENTAARRLNRPGEAIYNDANGLVEGNSPFQVAWLGDDERDEYLARVRDLARQRGLAPAAPVVFEGNIPADPLRNAALVRRIEAAAAGHPEPTPDGTPSAWIGDAVSITGPTAVSFPSRPGSNLLVVGHDSAAASGILSSCLVSLAVAAPANAESVGQFHVLSGEAESDRWQRLDAALNQRARLASDDAAAPVAEIAAEVKRRQEDRTSAAPVFLLIDGIGRFRELRRSDDDFGFGGFDREKTVSPGKLLADILRDGPGVGVHAIVWCDSYNTFDRWLGRGMLREFAARVALPMSATDSSNLIDSPAAGRLGPNRAILYLDEQGTTEKFRPYRPPTDDWLAWLAERLAPGHHGESNGKPLDIDEWVIT